MKDCVPGGTQYLTLVLCAVVQSIADFRKYSLLLVPVLGLQDGIGVAAAKAMLISSP